MPPSDFRILMYLYKPVLRTQDHDSNSFLSLPPDTKTPLFGER